MQVDEKLQQDILAESLFAIWSHRCCHLKLQANSLLPTELFTELSCFWMISISHKW